MQLSSGLTSRFSKFSRWFAATAAWGALALSLALGWDFYRFWATYQAYHERGLGGVEQLGVPPVEGERIVVLTGDMGRIPRAVELLRVRGGQSTLLISGAARGVAASELISQQGVSTANFEEYRDRVQLESDSSTTAENARYTRALLSPPPPRIILVTSDYHMGRSLAVFQKQFPGVEILPFSVPSILAGRDSFYFLWKTGTEYWKSIGYRLLPRGNQP